MERKVARIWMPLVARQLGRSGSLRFLRLIDTVRRFISPPPASSETLTEIPLSPCASTVSPDNVQ